MTESSSSACAQDVGSSDAIVNRDSSSLPPLEMNPKSAAARPLEIGSSDAIVTEESYSLKKEVRRQFWQVMDSPLLTLMGCFPAVVLIIFVIHLCVTYFVYGGLEAYNSYIDDNYSIEGRLVKLQIEINELDKLQESWFDSLKNEFAGKMENRFCESDLRLENMNFRSNDFLKFIDVFATKDFLSKEEFSRLFDEFKKAGKKGECIGKEVSSVGEMRECTKHIVDEEIGKHAADGLGMVDYALASVGGKVLSHSKPYGGGSGWDWLGNQNRVSADAKNMIRPSFGEPGQCFALKGESGFVEIRLGAAIIPEAVTLEHVAKSVAYDRLDAPKHCRVSGWMGGQDPTTHRKFLLTEFTYDLLKNNVQTFVVERDAYVVVDTIRFDFQSNHGKASHTCIYRLRVHGREYGVLS